VAQPPTRDLTGAESDAPRTRIPIAAIAVVGFGSLVAVAVGVVLYLGISSAATNTRELLQSQGEAMIDIIERNIDSQLLPAVAQSRWISRSIEDASLDLSASDELDAFMFGSLAGTPQVSGIAIVDSDARSRRWGRELREFVDENWANRPGILTWLDVGAKQDGPSWRAPFWTDTLDTTVLLHDTPLRRNGQFIGMLGQVLPIADLSRQLLAVQARTAMVPFILYGRQRVLAHPQLLNWRPSAAAATQAPLPKLDEVGDAVLERIWSPNTKSVFMLRDIQRTSASGVQIGETFYVYLYREIHRYGDEPWIIGAYINTDVNGGAEFERLVSAVFVGVTVLILSVLIAGYAGTRLSKPIQVLSRAASIVELHGLDSVPQLAGSRIRELDDATRSFNQMVSGLRDRELVRQTLGRFVPETVAQSLLLDGGRLEAVQTEATVLFCDLQGFTALTELLGPSGIMSLLNEYFEEMVAILERHNGVVTQFQGDAILATFNVPSADPQHAANALRAALEMRRAVSEHRYGGQKVDNRIGVNTGSVVAGAVGAKGRLSYTVHGDAVNLAARLEALNKELGTRVLVSAHTASSVVGFHLRPVGETVARGQSTAVAMFELFDEPPTC
jgi:adenylate cyclase